jgi:hypothetical protein
MLVIESWYPLVRKDINVYPLQMTKRLVGVG